MISPLFDIINNFYNEEDNKSESLPDYDNDEFPDMSILGLRRSHKMICINCKDIFCSLTPYIYQTVLCYECSDSIKDKSLEMKKSLDYKKNVLEKKKIISGEIIEFGLHPIRIKQTFMFETIELFKN